MPYAHRVLVAIVVVVLHAGPFDEIYVDDDCKQIDPLLLGLDTNVLLQSLDKILP
jgi:hypothetical protein